MFEAVCSKFVYFCMYLLYWRHACRFYRGCTFHLRSSGFVLCSLLLWHWCIQWNKLLASLFRVDVLIALRELFDSIKGVHWGWVSKDLFWCFIIASLQGDVSVSLMPESLYIIEHISSVQSLLKDIQYFQDAQFHSCSILFSFVPQLLVPIVWPILWQFCLVVSISSL